MRRRHDICLRSRCAYSGQATRTQAIKWATEARQLALKYGDTELASAIERNLASIK